ncbi:unnamed protein product, partial [Mycena citricolor]
TDRRASRPRRRCECPLLVLCVVSAWSKSLLELSLSVAWRLEAPRGQRHQGLAVWYICEMLIDSLLWFTDEARNRLFLRLPYLPFQGQAFRSW